MIATAHYLASHPVMSTSECDSIVSVNLAIEDPGDCVLLSNIDSKDIQVYPNPLQGNHITLSGLPQGVHSLIIIDALGREVAAGNASNGTPIPLNLPSGVFILSLPDLDIKYKLIK